MIEPGILNEHYSFQSLNKKRPVNFDPALYKYRSLLIEVTYFTALKQRKGHFISTYEKIGFINNANTYKMASFKAIETGFVWKKFNLVLE